MLTYSDPVRDDDWLFGVSVGFSVDTEQVYFVGIIIMNYHLLASGLFYYNNSVFLAFWDGTIKLSQNFSHFSLSNRCLSAHLVE